MPAEACPVHTEQFNIYFNVLKSNRLLEIRNSGFRRKNYYNFLYKQDNKGLNSFYAKRGFLNDEIHTIPLDL